MASAGTGTGTTSVALLFSFSAVLFLFLLHLQAPAPGLAVADLLASALDRFRDGHVGLMELASRRNMILLCHAILFLILRDAGLLGKPASRRSTPSEAATATNAVVVVAQPPTAVPVPARPHATRNAVVVWRRRRPRNRAVVVAPVHEHDHDAAGRVVVECCWPAVQAVASWAAPPAQVDAEAAAVATKQIVLAEPSPRNDDDDVLMLDHHDRACEDVIEPLEHPTVTAEDGESGHRRIADNDEKRTDDTHPTAGMEMEMELADDSTFEEFIKSQRRMMRQESLQLLRLSDQYQAMAAMATTCY